MGYKVQPKIRIDLGDLGDNNGTPFFVEIKNPKMMSFEEKKQFAKFSKLESEEEQVLAMKEVTKDLIIAWNLLDMETEQPLNPHNIFNGKDPLDCVPSDVVTAIFKQFTPKQDDSTKNSLPQSDKS